MKKHVKAKNEKVVEIAEGPKSLLELQKNKVRGVIGSTKKHRHEAFDKDLALRTSIRKTIAEARYQLPREYRAEFFHWLGRAGVEASNSFSDIISQGLINEVVETRRTSLYEEILWVGTLLTQHIEKLKGFIRYSHELDFAFWSGDWSKSKNILELIKESYGDSVWLLNAEISLRQHFEGLESQKNYAATIQKLHRGGLPGYLSFFISVRNEERSTYSIFDEEVRGHIEKTKLPESTKAFFLYKLTGAMQLNDNLLSDVLQFETTNSFIDLYETLIDILQRCVVSYSGSKWTAAAVIALKSLIPVGDNRVLKLINALDVGESYFVPTSEIPQSVDKFQEHIPANFWGAIWPIVCHGKLQLNEISKSKEINYIRSLLGSLLLRDDSFEDSRVQLAKFTRNFSFLRTARAAGDFSDFVTMRVPNTPLTLSKVLLNSENSDLFDGLVRLDDWGRLSGEEMTLFSNTEGIENGVIEYLAALSLAMVDRTSALEKLINIDRKKLSQISLSFVDNLILQIYIDEGESDEAIRLVGKYIADCPSIINAIPASLAIGDRGWESLSLNEDKIALSIALYAVWKQTDDSLRTTHLRFSFEDALGYLGITYASEVNSEFISSNNMLQFFLKNICIPVLMDTSGLFSTTDELLDERLKILSCLSKADQRNIDLYDNEALSIKNLKLIKNGLDIVDNNRVTVDAGAISRWAIKRYQESYNRYQALRSVGIGSSDRLDVVFDKLKFSVGQAEEQFSIPDNEADSLLLSILLALNEKFLHDEQYGLEYFLGKRIRHGTISGHIRGPAETNKLISERPGPGKPYEPNFAWMSQLTFKSPENEQHAKEAFSLFSEKYDAIIAEVRDKYLHVKSSNHPDGLLVLTFDAIRYHLVRAFVRPDLGFEEFIEAYITVLWSLLEAPLHQARSYLVDNVKAEILKLYASLQEGIRSNVIHDDSAMRLSAIIQATSTQVQRELDIVGDWFVRGESQQASHMFGLEEVLEIAIRSSLKSLPNFSPSILREISGAGKTTTAVLVTLSDIIFIVFDNIHRRASVGSKPEVNINFGLSSDNQRLLISIKNPVSPDLNVGLVKEKLNRIRKKIENDELVRGAFVEGESGLLKIAAHAQHFKNSNFMFELVDGYFFTKVEFPVIYLEDRFSLPPPEDEQ